GSLCNLCGPEGCYGCSKTCQDGEYINVSKCTCANCEDSTDGYGANCIKCDGEKCFQCSNGYYLVNQSKKCKICPEGYYCNDGKVATKCPQGYQCPTPGLSDPIGCEEQTYQANEGATSCNACESNQYSPATASACTNCTTTYNQGCTTCTTSGCTGVQSGYYLKNNHAYPLSSIQNCSAVNSTGCTLCNSGYYLKDKHTCNLCNTINGCSTCSHSALSCTSCSIGYYQSNSSTCNLCSDAMTNCSTCSSGTSCTKCNSSAYYLSNHTCHACTSLSGCTLCNSSLSGCQGCNNLHTLTSGFCSLNCPSWCAQCSSGNNNCSVCPTGYYRNSSGSCQTCETITGCTANGCNSTNSSCTQCSTGYVLKDSYVCTRCAWIVRDNHCWQVVSRYRLHSTELNCSKGESCSRVCARLGIVRTSELYWYTCPTLITSSGTRHYCFCPYYNTRYLDFETRLLW
ncbi:hypothetical protein IJ670_08115, partial [bacterium]|nr:hypothetical protein [bacterium]